VRQVTIADPREAEEPGSVLDRESSTPLWIQLRALLRARIDANAYGPDDQLPSESELCERYGVSRAVVREALGDLVAQRLVYKIKGKGAFVAPRKLDEDFVGSVMSFSGEMTQRGRVVTTRVLEQVLEPASARIAASLRLAADEPVLRLRRLRAVDGRQRLLVTSTLPGRLVPGLERANLENLSLYDTIRRRYGLDIARAERWIEPVLPTREEAALMELSATTPLLRIESISWTGDGTPIEHYDGLYLTEGSRLHVLSRRT
jgi:GntR family transcriptional regulator